MTKCGSSQGRRVYTEALRTHGGSCCHICVAATCSENINRRGFKAFLHVDIKMAARDN